MYFLSITYKAQHYTIFFFTVNALHVSVGFSVHHQELKNCTHSIGYMSSLLAAAASMGESPTHPRCARRTQSVQRLNTAWTVRGSMPVGARFCAPGQTGPGAHRASYKMGIASFARVMRPRCGVDKPLPSRAMVKERVEV
jgi:hypothetical protein